MDARYASPLVDNNKNGMSFWFNATKTSDAADQTVAQHFDFVGFDSHGDFNLNHADLPDGNLNDVPLPAAGWLLIAAFGGLAAAKRRKA